MEPISRSQERRKEFKGRITHAAIKLIAQNGLKETPVAAIIQEAGVAHKTFFNYFPTKHDLLVHISIGYFAKAQAAFPKESVSDLSSAQQLERSLMQIADWINSADDTSKSLLRYLTLGASYGPEENNKDLSSVVTQLFYDFLKKAEHKQELRTEFSVEVYSDIVCGIFIAVISNWAGNFNIDIMTKMQSAVDFIKISVFKPSANKEVI